MVVDFPADGEYFTINELVDLMLAMAINEWELSDCMKAQKLINNVNGESR